MTVDDYAFRVRSLDEEQLRILKGVWAELFKFWGIRINSDAISAQHRKRAISTSDVKKNRSRSRSTIFRVHTSSEVEECEDTKKLSDVHESLQDMNPDETRDDFWNMIRGDFPDALLLRFIRARKWDLDKSLEMIAKTMEWRVNESKVDTIIYEGERAAYTNGQEGFLKNLTLQKAVICGRDKEGRPIVCVRPKLHRAKDQNLEEMKRYSLLIIEQARLFLKDPVDTATVIFDLSDFSMSNMDYAPVQFLITCFEAHYPESLGRLYIHKAPWIFSPIWKVIKKWLDPVVASKIYFTKTTNDLKDYIDCDQLPEYLDGTNKIDLNNYKKIDESHDRLLNDHNTRNEILEKRRVIINNFIDVTRGWIESNNSTESSTLLMQRISIGRQLSSNYSELDPYIRSRSKYDINGMLDI
ncbi:CRAL-TRIO domain-containing protein [Nakaseomyces bracarensis]|uniref:CRAL-TRIO domain-containing protein n=1 Tax=Nakaseomyces bracarensis TaxID=273131 RepID=UPI00387254D4